MVCTLGRPFLLLLPPGCPACSTRTRLAVPVPPGVGRSACVEEPQGRHPAPLQPRAPGEVPGAHGDGRARLNRRLRRRESRRLLWPARPHRVLPGQGSAGRAAGGCRGWDPLWSGGTADSGAVRWPALGLADPVLEGCEPGQVLYCQECF